MNKEEMRQKIEEGYILFNSLVEIMGKPKEHVQEAMEKVLAQLEEDTRFTILKKEIQDAVDVEGSENLLSIFAELEILVKDFSLIYDFIFAYMPSSLEIIDPQEVTFQAVDASGILNDLSGRLHQADLEVKTLAQQKKHMALSIETLIMNCINLSLAQGSRTKEQLAKQTGVKDDQLQVFLDRMEADKKIQKEGEAYILPK